MSCCAIDQSNKKCVDISYDDSKCDKLYECCGGIHDAGLQEQCLQRVRKCRKLGNAWDALGPLKPLKATTMFTGKPGYTTQGELLEAFQGSFKGLTVGCILRSSILFLIIGMIFKIILKTSLSYNRIIIVSLIAGLIRCMVESL